MTEPTEPEIKATLKPGTPVLTAEERVEIRRLVGEGELRPIECARKFGITPAGISYVLGREPKISFECLKKAREEEIAAAVTKAAAAKAVSFAELRLQRIEETKTSLYTTNIAIATAFQRALKDHLNGGARLTIKELRMLQAGIGENRKERYDLLNAEKEIDANELPEIVIRDLTDEEILEMQMTDEMEIGEQDAPEELEAIE